MKEVLFLFFLFITTALNAQKVTGTVHDAEGNILPFASIMVKNTSLGTTANKEGYFELPLTAGDYTIICRYVGYTLVEKNISVINSATTILNFTLPFQKLTLKEVVIHKNGEDPAFQIIRNAISKRGYYDNEVKSFEAEIYIKDIVRLKSLPSKFMGKPISEDDKKQGGLDSSGKGILYLSESVNKVSVKEVNKVKMEVKSSRVSGSSSFGFDIPAFVSFYKNNVTVFTDKINPRGFISPIADGAFNFYKYKFLGTFFEEGEEVNVIKVIPRRKYEPLFSGTINITEGDWRIYSCDLLLTKESQLQIVDSVHITQIFTPIENDIWRIKSQVVHFDLNQFGIKAGGDFVNVYSNYNLHPDYPKKYFDRVIMKYDSGVNKKTSEYWDSVRPIPLTNEEAKDFKVKDSILRETLDSLKRNRDSIIKPRGSVTIKQIFWSGINRTSGRRKSPITLSWNGLIKTLQFNTVEGFAVNPSLVVSKNFPDVNKTVAFIADARYGFSNQHLNPWGGLVVSSGIRDSGNMGYRDKRFFVAGGKRVSQFFKESSLDGLGNSIASLFYGRNDLKIYENYFVKTGFSKRWESGVRLLVEGQFEDRLPIDNTTDFILNKKWLSRYTPNYPADILSQQFPRHQATIVHALLSFKPGQRYIQFPNYKMSIGSKYPLFTIGYTKGIKHLFGSDVDFDKWMLNIHDDLNFKLAGLLKYAVTIGGFLNSKAVFVQDYKHFYGNTSHIAEQYVMSFENVGYYQFSNASSFYTEVHLEHHANGMLTNKIPGFKKLNWNLVAGTNILLSHPQIKYAEAFVGLENIFKIFRVDAVAGFQNGFKPVITYRIGFGGLLGDVLNAQRFRKTQKIVDEW